MSAATAVRITIFGRYCPGDLLQMELAPLPRSAREHRFPSILETLVRIADGQLDAV